MSSPRRPLPWWLPVSVYVLTLAQLAFAALVPGIERFADKAFGARLLAYALLMAVVPVIWFLAERRRQSRRRPPYGAFTLVMLPFLIDVTGNSLDLYDSVVFWDDLNHFVNWALLCSGLGAIWLAGIRPAVGRRARRHRARRRAGDRLGARRVVDVHPARDRARHGVRGHPRGPDARHPRCARRGAGRASVWAPAAAPTTASAADRRPRPARVA